MNPRLNSHPANILGPECCGTLNQCLEAIAITEEIIAKAKAAGVPVEAYEQIVAEQKKLAAGLKREFFPETP